MALRAAASKPYFESIFRVIDYNRQFYEASLNYTAVPGKLADFSEERLTSVIIEILNNLECDAWPTIQSIKLILHSYLTHQKAKPSKKVCLVVENFPENDIGEIKAHSIDHFITFEAVVIAAKFVKNVMIFVLKTILLIIAIEI